MTMRTCKNCKQMEKVENMTFICENYFCLKCKNDGAVKAFGMATLFRTIFW